MVLSLRQKGSCEFTGGPDQPQESLTAETRIIGPSDLIHIYHINKHHIPVLTFIDNFSHALVLVLASELIHPPKKTKHTSFFLANYSVFKLTTLIFLLLGKKKKASLAVFPSKLY